MKSFITASDRAEVNARFAHLTGTEQPKWGRMTVNQMLCHLTDSYLLALGERQASMATGWFQQTVMKWVALNTPLPWPKNLPTRPEMAQGVGGTLPSGFHEDRTSLLVAMERFCDEARTFDTAEHPLFAKMSRQDWLRWGYLHADHHLRQFGV